MPREHPTIAMSDSNSESDPSPKRRKICGSADDDDAETNDDGVVHYLLSMGAIVTRVTETWEPRTSDAVQSLPTPQKAN